MNLLVSLKRTERLYDLYDLKLIKHVYNLLMIFLDRKIFQLISAGSNIPLI